jgi:hypothetical protein
MIKRKHIAGIIMVMCFAVGIVAALAWVSLRPISQKNGFLRNVRQNELQLANVIPKGSDIIGIAGATEYHIYFKTKDPSVIWQTNYNLNQGKYIRLRTPAMSKLASAFNVVVDSPKVHILAGNVPAVIETDLNGGGVVIFKFPTALFTRAV